MIMPFGKFKGTRVIELPEWYAKWCLENMKLYGKLKEEMTARLSGHYRFPDDEEPEEVEVSGLSIFEIERLHRKYSMIWHPDRGGDNEAMKAVNQIFEELILTVKTKI